MRCTVERTHPVGLAGKVESTAFEAVEVLEEDSHESCDVIGRLHRRSLFLVVSKSPHGSLKGQATHDRLAIVGIGKADTDGLVDEEYVRVLVPGIRVVFRRVRARRTAWTWFAFHQPLLQTILKPERLTQFHEEAHRRRGAGAAVRPEDDVIRVGVAAALEEVEEQVARLDVDVPAVRAEDSMVQHRVTGRATQSLPRGLVTEVRLFDARAVTGEGRVREPRELGRREQGQVA